MADHPLIGAGPNEVPFLLGTEVRVWDVVRVWRHYAPGRSPEESIPLTATFLGIGSSAVSVALAYWDGLSAKEQTSVQQASEADASAKKKPDGAIELVGRIFALFAGLTTLVYVTGGFVLATRLALGSVPWQPVVSQLPREFLISVGVSQVLTPALIVGALYAAYRFLRRPQAPQLRAWSHEDEPELTRARNRWRFRGIWASLTVPSLALVLATVLPEVWGDKTETEVFGVHLKIPLDVAAAIVACIVVPIAASIAVETRGRLAAGGRHPWDTLRSGATMTAVYAGFTVPIFVAVCASVFELNPAKVCATEGFAEVGDLIGQTSESVYLGEHRPGRHAKQRIAVFPMSQVDELFIGPKAAGAQCDPRSAQGVVEASLRRTEASEAAARARDAARAVHEAKDDAAAVKKADKVVAATHEAANRARAAGHIVFRTLEARAIHVWDVAARAISAKSDLHFAIGRAPREQLEALADAAARAATRAEVVTRRAVRALLREAKKQSEAG